MAGWAQEDKDRYCEKLYAKTDGEDNLITYVAYRFLEFLKIKKRKTYACSVFIIYMYIYIIFVL
jgi:hypothetical protein